MTYLEEAQVEIASIDYLCELGYEYIHGHVISDLKRKGYDQVVLLGRLGVYEIAKGTRD